MNHNEPGLIRLEVAAGTAFVSPGLAQNGRAAASGKLIRWRLDVAMAKVTDLRHVMEHILVRVQLAHAMTSIRHAHDASI